MLAAGKLAIVTGGASGIGRASAELLAANGARVLVADLDEPAGAETVVSITARGGSAWFRRLDVSAPDEVEAALGEAVARHGPLNILHNCAGLVSGSPDFPDTSAARIARLIAVNLTGTLLATRAAIKLMRATGGGVIINMSSTMALLAAAPDPVYAASKAAIKTFTEQYAPAAYTHGIRLNAILPGAVDTPIIGKTGDGGGPADWLALRLQEITLLAPATIASAVLELVEDDSRYGESIVIANDTPDDPDQRALEGTTVKFRTIMSR